MKKIIRITKQEAIEAWRRENKEDNKEVIIEIEEPQDAGRFWHGTQYLTGNERA